MFILSDESNVGINPLFPLVSMPFEKINVFDFNRMASLVPYFLAAELTLFFMVLKNLLSLSENEFEKNCISIGIFSLILARVFFRKIIAIKKEKVKILKIAPSIIWVDHFFLFLTIGCGFLLNIKNLKLNYFDFNFYFIFSIMCFAFSIFPFLNLIIYRVKSNILR